MGEWLRDNLDALTFAVAVIALLVVIVFAIVRITGRRPIPAGALLVVVAGMAVVVLWIVLTAFAPSPPRSSPSPTERPLATTGGASPGPTAPPPSESEEPGDSLECQWHGAPVQWDNSGLGQDAVPQTGHDFRVAIGSCESVLLDGTRFQLEDGTSCDGQGIALCVVVWQSVVSYSTVVTNLDTASNFVGHTPSSYQYAIDDKEPLWWTVPNCTQGCSGAYITVYVGGQRIKTNTLVEPEP